jgi:hypothetical protein
MPFSAFNSAFNCLKTVVSPYFTVPGKGSIPRRSIFGKPKIEQWSGRSVEQEKRIPMLHCGLLLSCSTAMTKSSIAVPLALFSVNRK